MKNKYLILIIVILSVIAIISSQQKTTFFNQDQDLEITLKDDEEEINLALEEYVIGVVAAEMPASFSIEALKAQAIASRTYAVYMVENSNASYDVVNDVSNQVYITEEKMHDKWGNDFDKYYQKIKEAVNSTNGLVMKYNGNVISSYYFAMSNGKTEDVSLVFGEAKDYLKSVDSTWDEEVNNFEVTTTMTREEFCTKLNLDCQKLEIGSIDYSPSGRVNTIVINKKEYTGVKIRSLLNLRSTDFTITIKDNIAITTRGYGHGVGMSQYGANAMAKNGSTYEEILKYYYQNIEIEKINV